MKAGTTVEIKNRGRATIVYNQLDGYGVIWGEQEININDLPKPEAMLREKYPSANIECVGKDYKVIK